jgi:lipopolysaccharide export system ATP-binding protein
MNKLQTVDLLKIYNNKPVVNKINIEFKQGEITGLVGRNGAGKTTTFLMLCGIVKPDSGNVVYNDAVINTLPSHERARKGLVYLPQQHSIFVKATVFDNLFQLLELKMESDIQARRETEALLEEYGLTYVSQSKGYHLSGGEKRRLEIARAMVMKPHFLFLDEPFTGIDPITIISLQKIILGLKQKGIGVIITDHNIRDTFTITDTVYVIHNGLIVGCDSPENIVQQDDIRKVFLGKDFNWERIDLR